MSRETRSTGARAMVLGAVAGAALLPAGTAEANVVGIGNAAFGNTCANQGGARAGVPRSPAAAWAAATTPDCR
ncbi:hypothetical protein OG473_37145 [Streptomyces anulatus]|uniref:hypothetical protein n=1 Tax=Streptomyces anulatus TaxID=1892 RepID=UPI0032445D7C